MESETNARDSSSIIERYQSSVKWRKKDIVQFHPFVSIIYTHNISRSRSIKGVRADQIITTATTTELYWRIVTPVYLQYRRWAIHGTTFRIITDRIIRIWSYIRIIHEWKVSFNKRKKDTVENENRITKSTYTLSLCDTWSLIRNFYCVLRILHYEKKITRDKKKGVTVFSFFFFFVYESINQETNNRLFIDEFRIN